ncbi:hypothetical protein KC343_g3010 [Hortaea werneckii]|nr:hypothetical protein KC352_g8417 [Hortaea werneckii]KAI7569603.1 hypothetical protein KC317_g3188 [Hortaea werneckii]KAI7623201.1 hypothetical protein KC346_g2847 [Hortaea werneckii]KAI7633303.1 hypothetical protein KC343_g3010 [Hortaea werneckii]KAI7679205.1 hypothetical protein KC319_g2893 [Hortaea werneckii]
MMAGANTYEPLLLDAAERRGDLDGHDQEIELSSVARSPAPSYVSKSSFRDREEQAEEVLLPGKGSPFLDAAKSTSTTIQSLTEISAGASNREKRRKLQGWRFGVTVAASTTFAVLILNTTLAVYAGIQYGSNGAVGTALDGKCEEVNTWATVLHILINALSSILLSASNYTMQCLCSPTRAEINRAHARGDWLDIGVASFRNLSRINKRRTVLWWILALSSVPIHLLYNSVIFKTLAANEYLLVVANTDFLQGKEFAPFYLDTEKEQFYASNANDSSYAYLRYEGPSYYTVEPNDTYTSAIRDVQLEFSRNNNYANDAKVHNLSASECITAYGTSFVSEYRNIVAVTSARGNQTNNTVLYSVWPNFDMEHGYLTYGWICLDNPNTNGYGDLYELVMTECDVASSRKHASDWTVNKHKIDYCLAQVAQPHCKLQFSLGILATVIVMNACLCLGALVLTIYLLTQGFRQVASRTSASLVFKSGFGSVDARALIDIGLPQLGSAGLVLSVLLANLPQAIVSFLYLTYNGLFTCMCLAHEYSQYGLAGRKKPLRVTTPHGQQRSTYYLQLPFRYAAPLLIASTTVHWLISQSIFLARISTSDYKGRSTSGGDFSEVGYSCLPILLAILLGTAMLIAAFACGFRKFASHIPVAGSCSVALAAAAHRPKDDIDAAFLPVQWGEVRREGTDEVGHCCFTSQEVHDLTPGRKYAGTARTPYHDSSDGR